MAMKKVELNYIISNLRRDIFVPFKRMTMPYIYHPFMTQPRNLRETFTLNDLEELMTWEITGK